MRPWPITSHLRVVVGYRATVLAVALFFTAGLGTPSATIDDLLAALHQPNLKARQAALDGLWRDSSTTVRRRVKQELLAGLGEAETTYLRRLVALARQTAATRRDTYGAAIATLQQRLWALLKQRRTHMMWPVYHQLRHYWSPPPATLETSPDLARAKTDIIWYTTRSRELGTPVPPVSQRLADLRHQAHLEGIAHTAPDAERAVMASTLMLRQTLQAGEFEVLMLTNEYRTMMGLHALKASLPLTECARQHSEDMRVHKFFGHHSPQPERQTLAHRARLCGQRVRSENIARHCTTGTVAFRRWFGSSPHHRNMLDTGHQEIGVGQSETYYTEWFN